MTGRGFLVVAGASLLSLHMGGASGSEAAPKATHKAVRVDCLGPMNLAREEVGFPDFEAATTEERKLPIVDSSSEDKPTSKQTTAGVGSITQPSGQSDAEQKQATFLESFCTNLLKNTGTNQNQNQAKGTYMYAPDFAESGGDCKAAVEYWKSAKVSFPPLPPVYSANERLYENDLNVSFVGLFNPKDKPTVDCAYITCNAETSNGDTVNGEQSSSTGPHPPVDGSAAQQPGAGLEQEGEVASDEEEQKKDDMDERRLEEKPGPTYSLVCLSSPRALLDAQAPFTQEEWDKIMGVANSSTQPKVCALVAIAMAFAGRLLH